MHNIRYLRVIVTNSCNLNCFFCHREGNTGLDFNNQLDIETLIEDIHVLVNCGIKKIKLMGGEPTLCNQLGKLIKVIKDMNTDLDVSMVTNAVVNRESINEYIEAGIDRINVSLHGFDYNIFNNITKGKMHQFLTVIDNILYMKKCGILGKINYVLLKGINEDEFLKVLSFVQENDIVVDVLNYLGDDDEKITSYFYSFKEIEHMIKKSYTVNERYVYENPSSLNSIRLSLMGGGTVNLKVNQLREYSFLKACQKCEKSEYCKEGIAAIRLTNFGIIKPCIFRDDLYFDMNEIDSTLSLNDKTKIVNGFLESL